MSLDHSASPRPSTLCICHEQHHIRAFLCHSECGHTDRDDHYSRGSAVVFVTILGRFSYRWILTTGPPARGGNCDHLHAWKFVFFRNRELCAMPLVLVSANHDVSAGSHTHCCGDSPRLENWLVCSATSHYWRIYFDLPLVIGALPQARRGSLRRNGTVRARLV